MPTPADGVEGQKVPTKLPGSPAGDANLVDSSGTAVKQPRSQRGLWKRGLRAY